MSENTSTILLTRFQFCHVQDTNTGVISLFEGPKRLQLESHQKLLCTQDKIRVQDGQFAEVFNPFDPEKNDIVEGEREVRIGPCVFSLHPGESIHKGVQNEHVLTDEDGLLLRAEKDCPHPDDGSKTLEAGSELVIVGPRKYIPHKDIFVKELRHSISLSEHEGIYVQDDDTGVVTLVKGPEDIILRHNQSLWDKMLTDEESEALGFSANSGNHLRVLSAAPRPRHHDHEALVIELEDKECICLFEGDKIRVEFGPQSLFIGPHERPKVLHISGNVPIKPNALRLCKLGLGPDFIRDQLTVRTRDNATLRLEVTYRWVFRQEENHPEKLFALKDFVGFVAQTLSSEIREEAASHKFEEFHSKAAELVKNRIFGQTDESGNFSPRLFTENCLEIFGVDVEGITPADKEIADKLADAIKTNVDIYTRRVQEEAQLESERRLIDGRAKNEEVKAGLIKLEIENERTRKLEHAKIAAEVTLSEAEASAKASTITADAQRNAEEQRLQVITSILASAGGAAYIQLEQAKLGQGAKKVFVVPTDSRIHLGVGKITED